MSMASVTVCRGIEAKGDLRSRKIVVDGLAHHFLAVLGLFVVERIAAVGGAQNGAAARQDAGDSFERELERLPWPDEAVEAIGDADDLLAMLENAGGGAYYGVEAGRVAASGNDADAADVGHRLQLLVVFRSLLAGSVPPDERSRSFRDVSDPPGTRRGWVAEPGGFAG
jgi:hypothetical protein